MKENKIISLDKIPNKVNPPNPMRRGVKRTARNYFKQPHIPKKMLNPNAENLSITSDSIEDEANTNRNLEGEEIINHFDKVKCDNYSCYIENDNYFIYPRTGIKVDLDDTVELAFNSNDWIFTQITGLASVNIFDNYKITPATTKFVNNNGNAFSDRILKKYYKTFIGAHNFRNHKQVIDESYGIILDAVLREIPVNNEESVYYVDLLIATNKVRHPEWTQKIENKIVRFGSMGAESSSFKCTYCGNIPTSYDEFCDHFKLYKGKYYIDPASGKKLRIAHLVEDYKNKEGKGYVEFVEYSFLDIPPAFEGASMAHVIKVPQNTNVKFSIPRQLLTKSAFNVWKEFYKINDNGNNVGYDELTEKLPAISEFKGD